MNEKEITQKDVQDFLDRYGKGSAFDSSDNYGGDVCAKYEDPKKGVTIYQAGSWEDLLNLLKRRLR
ncbi:hypothetical protein TUMEXPCC7403_02340 [Tumidithrix helvetica PCC 7403]|uniref:hypothetical protein n=1 Tax=Tumidithrix helvetica TaxID=3457545 RepID=UPI003C81860D